MNRQETLIYKMGLSRASVTAVDKAIINVEHEQMRLKVRRDKLIKKQRKRIFKLMLSMSHRGFCRVMGY